MASELWIGYNAKIKVSAKVNQFALDNTALGPKYSIDSSTGINSVLVNFVCHLDWAIDICSSIILGVSLRMFFDEINL